MTTIICEERINDIGGATVAGEDLWLPASDLDRASGWTLKPEGVCLGDDCVPIPPGREDSFVRSGAFNLTNLWRHLGKPVVHDEARETWLFGEGSSERRDALTSLQAPDFQLPDREGKLHSLSDYAGRKVFLTAWASW